MEWYPASSQGTPLNLHSQRGRWERFVIPTMIHSNQSEIIRLQYKYRRLIQKGKLHLSHQSAAKLIGPDCAYHLYSLHQSKTDAKTSKF
jgi:hypothetical protein